VRTYLTLARYIAPRCTASTLDGKLGKNRECRKSSEFLRYETAGAQNQAAKLQYDALKFMTRRFDTSKEMETANLANVERWHRSRTCYACKPRYGSAINRIYTCSGASKRGRRVSSASLVSVPLPRVFSSLNVRAPRESLYKKKRERYSCIARMISLDKCAGRRRLEHSAFFA